MALLFCQFFGTLLLRSSLSGALTHRMRYLGRLRKRCLACSAFPPLTRPLRLHAAEISRVRVLAFPLRFSASSPRHHPHRLPSRLTSRSSRPHIVASTACYALRLHAVAAPLWVGLTPALGGRKALDCFAFQHVDFTGFDWRCSSVCLPLRCCFGQVRQTRSNLSRVTLAGFGNGDWCAQLSRN